MVLIDAVTVAVGSVVLCALLIIRMKYKANGEDQTSVTEPDDVISHRSVSYNELSFAPNNFSCNNLLGREVWEKFIRAN